MRNITFWHPCKMSISHLHFHRVSGYKLKSAPLEGSVREDLFNSNLMQLSLISYSPQVRVAFSLSVESLVQTLLKGLFLMSVAWFSLSWAAMGLPPLHLQPLCDIRDCNFLEHLPLLSSPPKEAVPAGPLQCPIV